MPGCGARGQNLLHLENVVFLEVHILTATYRKAFIRPCRVGFHSMTSNPRVYVLIGKNLAKEMSRNVIRSSDIRGFESRSEVRIQF